MMTIATLMQALIAVGSFAALLILVYGPWQEVCTDTARQIIFEKRDAIFDLARSGKLSFDSREYGIIRSSLQSSIRFAHQLTWPRFVVMTVVLLAHGSRPEDNDLSQAISRITDPVTRNQVDTLVKQAYRALFLMMIAKSPAMTVLLVLALLPGLLILRCLPILNRVKAIEPRARGFIQLEADAT
jgi:hypothetical protein